MIRFSETRGIDISKVRAVGITTCAQIIIQTKVGMSQLMPKELRRIHTVCLDARIRFTEQAL